MRRRYTSFATSLVAPSHLRPDHLASQQWDEEMEAQVAAMEAAQAAPAAAVKPVAAHFASPAYPPLQLKPPAASPPSILKPTSFRLPAPKPTAQMVSKPKARALFKTASKAKGKPKARAQAAQPMHNANGADGAGGDGDEEDESANGNAHGAPKIRTKLAPAFPPVCDESIGAPFIDVDAADTWIYPGTPHWSLLHCMRMPLGRAPRFILEANASELQCFSLH